MRRVKDACTKPARSPLLANARSGSQHATKVRTKGQATVEAALLIPALLISLLLLIQPGILLYTRMVMEGAAAEGCRVLATASSLEENTETVEGFIKRRLASVPKPTTAPALVKRLQRTIPLPNKRAQRSESASITLPPSNWRAGT